MIKTLLQNRLLIVLLIIAFAIKVFSLNEEWVETYYTYGIYPSISSFLRILFGWIPISMGDILYTIAAVAINKSGGKDHPLNTAELSIPVVLQFPACCN